MGGKSSTTTQQVKIPPEVMQRYREINERAEAAASKPFQIYSTDPSAFVAQLNAQQQQGIQNVNEAAGAYKPYFEAAAMAGAAGMGSAQPQELNLDKFYNPYQQQVIDATMRQMGQANEQAQSGALGTAASSGAFGGDRAGIAAANLANQQGMAMGSTLAGLNAQNYNQALAAAQQQQGLYLGATQADLERMMAGGQFMAGLGSAAQQAGLQGAEAQINAGTLAQQTEQAGLNAMYNQFQQQQAYDFQVAQFLANIGMGTGALSGSTTTTTQPSSWFSDRRLKEDIRRIGHTDDGMPIYKYKYKGDDNHQTHIGFMADEVEQVKPEAVGVSGGYKTVDYDRATKAGGGGVAGPYSMQAGSDNPYAAGYVPQAYLPVGQLIVADSGLLQNANDTAAAQLAAAAQFGENLISLRDSYKTLTGKNVPPERDPTIRTDPAIDTAQGETVTTVRRPGDWRGGVVGYATGGPAYLQQGLSAGKNPVSGQTYLADTLKQQEAKKPPELQQPGAAPHSNTTMDDLGSAASLAASIATLASMSDRRMKHDIRRIGRTDHGMPIYSFKYKGDDREQTHIGFMADEVEKDHPDAVMTGRDGYKRVDYGQAHKFYQGGVVSRHGYATDGAVLAGPLTEEEAARRRLLAGDVPAATTLGSLPDARVTPVTDEAPARPALNFPTGVVPADAAPATPRSAETAGATAPRAAAPAANANQPLNLGTPAGIPFDGGVPEARSGWSAVAPDIVNRESGGDFDALYGFANRGDSPFAGTRISDMTIDEALAFSDPNGPYANWVRDQLGYVATPMGGYQIVGDTLRDAKERMGLSGDEQFSPEMQERIASWLYDQRGTEPWKASEGRGGLSVSSSGGPDMGGVAGGYGIGGDKPWQDRTTMGKMFFDRDGRVNKDALLSILGGIGTMASSPSRYLGAAILQGIGGAANTYMGQEARRQDITSANMTNADAFQRNYLRAVEGFGYQGSPEDYAREIGYKGPISLTGGLISPTGQTITAGVGSRTYRGAPLDYFGRGMTQMIELPGIGQVQAGQTYGYLKNLEAEMERAQRLGITVDPQALTDLRAKIAAHTGQIQTESGVVTDPTYMEAQLGQGAGIRDVAQSNEIALTVGEDLTAAREISRNTDELAKALEMMPSTGPLSDWYAGAEGIAGQLDLTDNMDYATAMQIAGKSVAEMARGAVNAIAGNADTGMVRDLVEQSTPSGRMTPKAIEELLAIRAGIAAYNEAFKQNTADVLAANPAANVAEVERQFTLQNRPVDYIEEARPRYRGIFVPQAAAEAGITQEAWRNAPEAERQSILDAYGN